MILHQNFKQIKFRGDFSEKDLANPKPARIPPQTPPAGGKSAEARRIHSPRQNVSPCLVRISNFNHLDFVRNTFELRPIHTARKIAHDELFFLPCYKHKNVILLLSPTPKFLLGPGVSRPARNLQALSRWRKHRL